MFDEGVVLEDVEACEHALAALCDALDPDAVPLSDVTDMHACLCRMHKLIAGAKTRLVRKVDESKAWVRNGDRSAAEYIARNEGISKTAAEDELSTSERLTECPETDEAVRNGKLSQQQTSAIADAASADPKSESRLLSGVRRQSLPELREECRRTKAAADPDPEVTYRRVRRSRFLRRHTDAEGGYNLSMRTTGDDGAEIDAALQPFIDRNFDTARRNDQHESPEAYAADALVDLARTTSNGDGDGEVPVRRGRESKIICLIDLEAFRRGYAEPGETCEIAGIGPVPVSTVAAMCGDAFIAAVVRDGHDVYNVAHLGRQVTAHQRTALEARGYVCEVPGCGTRHTLEIDHTTGWAQTKHTKLDELAWLCRHHHQLKTHCGYQLVGPPGRRRWRPPPDSGDPPNDAHTAEPATPPGDDPTLFDTPAA